MSRKTIARTPVAPVAPVAQPPIQPRQGAPLALAASAVAMQLVLGVPLFIGGYLRSAYANQCTQWPSGTIGSGTSFDCTYTATSPLTSPQIFYSGVDIWNTTERGGASVLSSPAT